MQSDSEQSEVGESDASESERESDPEDDFVAPKEPPLKKLRSMEVDETSKSKSKHLAAKKSTTAKESKKQEDEVSSCPLILLSF